MLFAYLTQEQVLLCPKEGTNDFYECTADEICDAEDAGTPISYKIDEDHEFYLKNWYTEMDLICTPGT